MGSLPTDNDDETESDHLAENVSLKESDCVKVFWPKDKSRYTRIATYHNIQLETHRISFDIGEQ